jgi:hypothetical protein
MRHTKFGLTDGGIGCRQQLSGETEGQEWEDHRSECEMSRKRWREALGVLKHKKNAW